jgi:hypothetical protein
VLDSARRQAPYERGEIKAAVNDCHAEMVALCRLSFLSKTSPLTVGKWDYDTLTDFGITKLDSIRGCYATSTSYPDALPLEQIELAQMLRLRQWPSYIPIRLRRYCFEPLTTFMLDYAPTSPNDQLTIYYNGTAADMLLDQDQPQVPRQFHDVLARWAIAMVARPKLPAIAQYYEQQKEIDMKKILRWVNTRGSEEAETAYVGNYRVPVGNPDQLFPNTGSLW